MATKPIRRPVFPVKLIIDSKYSTRRFFKNNYKVIHSLEIDKLVPFLILPKASCCNLLNIAQRIKSSSKLYLQKEEEHMRFKEGLNLKTYKKFKNVKTLSVSLPKGCPKSLVHVTNWLKVAKRLRTLHIHENYFHGKDAPVRFSQDLLKRLKKSKLYHFMMAIGRMGSNLSKMLLTFKDFPLSLKSLDFSWEGLYSYSYQESYQKIDFNKGLSQLKELRSLKLLVPFKLKTLQKLLLTVSDPSRFVFLDMSVALDDEKDKDALLLLKEGLEGFVSLERLRMSFKTYMRTLRHLEFLQECPIKYLEMQIELNDESMLFQLGYAIKIQGLQTLALRLIGSFENKIIDAHFSLMTQISELTQLQDLTLRLSNYRSVKKIPGLLNAFGDCVERLPHLRYLDFLHKQADFHSESTKLLSSLRRKAQHLTGLKFHFNNQSLSKSDLKLLLCLIEDAKFLEILNVDGLAFTEKEPFERLSKILSLIKPLRVVSFNAIGGNLNVEAFENMARLVLAKRGLERFFSNLDWTPAKYKKAKQFRGVNYSEILKSNPMLKQAHIPSGFNSSNPNLESCKWD